MNNFKSDDIIWIKHVSDENANGENTGKSYMDKNENEEFLLHFHKNFGDNAKSPKVGELILLFQKNKNGDRIFTHLVTPINDEIEQEDVIWMGGPKITVNGRRVKIIKKKKIPISSTRWQTVNFQGISHGNACKIAEVESCKNSLNDLLDDIWKGFNNSSQPKGE
jgi:hypothetical protein